MYQPHQLGLESAEGVYSAELAQVDLLEVLQELQVHQVYKKNKQLVTFEDRAS
jgi:hypothetical protein